MHTLLVIAVLVLFGIVVSWGLVSQVFDRRRQAFLTDYRFPHGLHAKMREKYPFLTTKRYHLVAQALRQYFHAYQASKFKFVGMPSRAADDLWHNFILYTKDYSLFCRKAFGRFFHHIPASSYSDEQKQENAGLKRTWLECCRLEGIDPRYPSRLPLLFAIDRKLGVLGAAVYELSRPPVDPERGIPDSGSTGDTFYVSDFSPSGDSGWGFGDFGGGDGGSGGDGGGGDGGGCGGGCGGGD